ncbi:aminodeoxyfutalosine deaminase [Desulfosarcina sp. BuS5]|uniref:amidohydrolase family protein n=2 Tax=Desulfosarcina sp. BuS5 TaxID=933262 RepID=UPI00237910E8|nr:amidohydrolase family protein [Desulfosarcina sp. BuS5]WDN88975.1 aminodeoxyfutalosine deaminase [Desulfosarcina sp. BuS5]
MDSKTIFRNGFLYMENGIIKDVGSGRGPGGVNMIDHGPGAIMPALVNTHTHLELTALKGKVTLDQGLSSWVKSLIKERESAGEALRDSAADGIREIIQSGCGVVGEISTLGLTWEAMAASSIYGIWFKEFIGNITNGSQDEFDAHKKNHIDQSLAIHAPHTTSTEMIIALKKMTIQMNLPFSIHLAESDDEHFFITTGKGAWADFLTERDIKFSEWDLPAATPVQYLDKLCVLDEHTIAVHLLHTDKKDLEILKKNGVQVCLCPRSNQNLHQRLPDIERMLAAGIKPCLGTDSLASAETLSIFDEMAFVSEYFPLVAPADILEMATSAGAKALALGNLTGSLLPGKKGIFTYVPFCAAGRDDLINKIVNADFNGLCDTLLLSS